MYSLSNDQAVWEVLTQPEGILAGVRAGQTALDMSTVSPETSRREFAAAIAAFVADATGG